MSQTQSGDTTSNDDLARQIAEVASAVEAQRVALDQHRLYVEGNFVTKEGMGDVVSSMKHDLVGEMTRQMKAVFSDAAEERIAAALEERLVTALETYSESEQAKERFAEMLEEHREIEAAERAADRLKAQQERREDFRRFGKQAAAVAVFILPFLQAMNIVIGWAGRWTGWW